MRCCKVICVYFGNRHKPPTNGHEMMKLIEFVVAKEREVDPGVDMDTIIVNNEAGFEPGNKMLDELDGQPTKRGKIRVLHRPNEGISFGAFSHAFEVLRDEYDYFFFTEEDVVQVQDNYYSRCIEKMEADPKLAYVGVSGLSDSKGKLHINGGIGCSSSQFLGEIFDELGMLPHAGGAPNLKRWRESNKKFILNGEIEFTHCFVRKGYKITDVELGDRIFDSSKGDTDILLRRKIWRMYK